MLLTPTQIATFKAWIIANAPVGGWTGDQQTADAANVLFSPNYFVWRSDASKATVDAQILKANYTPSDVVPTDTVLNNAIWQSRAFACQLKQESAVWITSGPASVSTIDARPASERQNFSDCMTGIPSGASGANQNAGWGTPTVPGAVRLSLMRTCSIFEKLFVAAAPAGPGNLGTDPRGNNTNPDVLGTGADGLEVAGPVSANDVSIARTS
jgi:hypothetical protein